MATVSRSTTLQYDVGFESNLPIVYNIYIGTVSDSLSASYNIVTSDIFNCTTLAISWLAAADPDTDEDDLTYTIQYSLNGGTTWITLTTTATTTDGYGTYTWDVSDLDLNTPVDVRVRAFDGYAYSAWTELPYDTILRDRSTIAECVTADHDTYIRDAYVKQLPPNIDDYSDIEVGFRIEDADGDLQTVDIVFYLSVPRNPAIDDVDVRDGIHTPLDLGDAGVTTVAAPTLIDSTGDIGSNIAVGWHTFKWRAQLDILPAAQLNTGCVAEITTDDGNGNTDVTYVPFVLDTRCPGNQAPILNITWAGQNIRANQDNSYGYYECGPDVLINYTVSDSDEDPLTVTLYYSLDGVTYIQATSAYCSGDIGDDVVSMTATRIVWNVEEEWASWDRDDRYQGTVYVKITVNDGHGHIVSDTYGSFPVDARGVDITSVTAVDAITGLEITTLTEYVRITAVISSYTDIDWVALEWDINGLDFHRYVTDENLDELSNNIAAGTQTVTHTFRLADYNESLYFIGTMFFYRVSVHNTYCHMKSYISHQEITRTGIFSDDFAVALDLEEGSNIIELVVETATGGHTRVFKTIVYDITAPTFVNAFATALNEFELVFDENLLEDGLEISSFTVTPTGTLLDWEGTVGTPTVIKIEVRDTAPNAIFVTVAPTIVQAQRYSLGYREIRDAADNVLLGNESTLASFEDNFVYDEAASGTKNGINTTFTTSEDFIAATLQVYVNGVRQTLTTDYTKTGTSTFQLVAAPASTDSLRVAYQKATSTLTGVSFNVEPTSHPADPTHLFDLPAEAYSIFIRVFVNGYRIQPDEYFVSGARLRFQAIMDPIADTIVVDYFTSTSMAQYWQWSEIPNGAFDSDNRDYSVVREVRRDTLEVFYNGLKLVEGITAVGDFAMASNQSFLTDIDLVPDFGDTFTVDYVINEAR